MKILLNTSLLIAGFRNPLPEGAVVTSQDDTESEQLVLSGYVSKTDKKPTHDHLSRKAEAAERAKKDAEAAATVTTDADAEGTTEPTGDTPAADAPTGDTPAADAKPVVTNPAANRGNNRNNRR